MGDVELGEVARKLRMPASGHPVEYLVRRRRNSGETDGAPDKSDSSRFPESAAVWYWYPPSLILL